MFTGIIESTGIVNEVVQQGSNKKIWIQSSLAATLKIDQSLSHSGVCLTVEEVADGLHRVTAVEETLQKTTLHDWRNGTVINLERCMLMNGRLDGHIVQGHVDTVATCTKKKVLNGSHEFTFTFREATPLVVEKGSVAINGVSLTCFKVTPTSCTVAIIPYTFEYTNFRNINEHSIVNIEFDIIGKYVQKMQSEQL